MRDTEIGRVVRALRHRLGWRRIDVARRAGMSQRQVSRLEAGLLEGLTLRSMRAIGRAVGLDLAMIGRWRGGELDRLLDADHAALQASMHELLRRVGWLVAVEVTFSEHGERGSIDLLAFHPPTGILLVIEIKTMIADIQGLLRPLDAKVRLAGGIARRLCWEARLIVPCLVIAEGTTNRRRLAEHAPLFARFSLRGGHARRWLAAPHTAGARPMILLRSHPASPGRSGRRAGRQRVRLRHASASVNAPTRPGASVANSTLQPPGG